MFAKTILVEMVNIAIVLKNDKVPKLEVKAV
jgi:hypothetical protein